MFCLVLGDSATNQAGFAAISGRANAQNMIEGKKPPACFLWSLFKYQYFKMFSKTESL